MTDISNVTLENTFYLVQLMHETALSKGLKTQVSCLDPIKEKMQNIMVNNVSSQSEPSSSSGIVTQGDFRRLLEISRAKDPAGKDTDSSDKIIERNELIKAMAAGKMPDVEIARLMEITREEVRLVLNIRS